MIGKRTKYINQVAVKCIKEAVKDGQFTLEPIDVKALKRVKIDKCEFVISGDGTFYLVYNEEVEKDYVEMWRDDVGGVLRKDLRTKMFDKYFEITTYGTRILARKVDEEVDSDIVLRFKTDNMIKICDFLYLPIKIVPKDGNYWTEFLDYTSVIDKEEEEVEEKKGAFDEDFEFEEYEDMYRLSKEDEEIENYYIPKEEY